MHHRLFTVFTVPFFKLKILFYWYERFDLSAVVSDCHARPTLHFVCTHLNNSVSFFHKKRNAPMVDFVNGFSHDSQAKLDSLVDRETPFCMSWPYVSAKSCNIRSCSSKETIRDCLTV